MSSSSRGAYSLAGEMVHTKELGNSYRPMYHEGNGQGAGMQNHSDGSSLRK